MKKIKQVVLKLLIACLVFTNMAVTPAIAAEKSPKLTTKRITMRRNSSNTIQVLNSNSKITWKSSDPGLVSISGTRGANRNTAVLKSGNQIGACVITATMKGKKLSCNVIVPKGTSIVPYTGNSSKISLGKLYTTPNDIWIRLVRRNGSNEDAAYGIHFYVSKYVHGKWQKMTPLPNTAFPEYAVEFPKKSYYIEDYIITNYYKRSDFTKGKYRIYVDSTYAGKPMSYVTFTIK